MKKYYMRLYGKCGRGIIVPCPGGWNRTRALRFLRRAGGELMLHGITLHVYPLCNETFKLWYPGQRQKGVKGATEKVAARVAAKVAKAETARKGDALRHEALMM